MEIQLGMDQAALDWLSSYLEDWAQYVVVEASRSRKRKMKRGVGRLEEGSERHYSLRHER